MSQPFKCKLCSAPLDIKPSGVLDADTDTPTVTLDVWHKSPACPAWQDAATRPSCVANVFPWQLTDDEIAELASRPPAAPKTPR